MIFSTDPNKLLTHLGEKAAGSGDFLRDRKCGLGKPGELFESLSEEEKEVLRRLKSSDIDCRWDAIAVTVLYTSRPDYIADELRRLQRERAS